ncbi:MAG: hypothetical protein DI498_12980 [Paracoccus denitrificans]|nr:MAG: hypothetical protein DI498_12980 [Paracoccus denitrificans]PZO83163.1 MAG: hypothetical protein DI633_12980 [Paracoccus denitrificans]
MVATAALPISPAAAQDGVFDMGQLTGTLSQDHVTQTEKKRAAHTGKQRTKRDPPEVVCARLPEYRAFRGVEPKDKGTWPTLPAGWVLTAPKAAALPAGYPAEHPQVLSAVTTCLAR